MLHRQSINLTAPGEAGSRNIPVPDTNVDQAPQPEAHPKVPQPEESGTWSATNSKVESAMHHRWQKTSLRHPAFNSQEFNALNSVDAYLGAARVSLEDAVNAMSTSLQVNFY